MPTVIESCDDVAAAVAAKPTDLEERRYIIKKSIDLGCIDQIPDEWEMELQNNVSA